MVTSSCQSNNQPGTSNALAVSTSPFHSTNLFLFPRQHILTNSVAPFSTYKATHNPQFLKSLYRRANVKPLNSLRRPIYVFNSVDQTLNYPVILSHRSCTTVSLETYPLYSMRNSVQTRETSIFEVLHLGSCFFLRNFNRTSKSRFQKRECAYFILIGVL